MDNQQLTNFANNDLLPALQKLIGGLSRYDLNSTDCEEVYHRLINVKRNIINAQTIINEHKGK